jgi:DNA-binding response OmpR family regulator
MRPGNRGQPVILIVDDDEYVYGAVRAVLRRTGATVVRASSAAEGVELARTAAPSLAILDVGLPDGDGYEVARTLRSDPAIGDPRIIILTGHAPDPSAADAAHVDAVIGKPFRLHEFLATVERLLNGSNGAGGPQPRTDTRATTSG